MVDEGLLPGLVTVDRFVAKGTEANHDHPHVEGCDGYKSVEGLW